MAYSYNYPPNQPPYGQQPPPPGGYPPYAPPQQPQPQQQPYSHQSYPQGYYPPPQQGGYPAPAPYGAPQGYSSGLPSHQQPQPQQQPPYGQQPSYTATHGYSYPPPRPYPPQQPPSQQYPPPQNYPNAPPQRQVALPPPAPASPSLGYIPGQVAPGDFRADADVLRQAMKGIGTDEATLIRVLSRLDPLQMAAVRETYSRHIGRDLYKDVKSETSGYFQLGLLAIIDGPLAHDARLVREAVAGLGTTEWKLNDVLLGRSNADLNAIKTTYQQKFSRSLARDVSDDLSGQTERLFTKVASATRHEESELVHPQIIESDVKSMMVNVTEVCAIFAQSSDTELRAINSAFRARFNMPLDKHIEREFSNHMEEALLRMLDTAIDPAMRDAILLEECMVGAGTKDEKLTVRLIRMHWDRAHLDYVRRAYHHRYRRDLRDRVRSELSGDYQKLMLAILE